MAAALTLASAGVWAAVMPGQQATTESGTTKRVEKRVVVGGDDDGPTTLRSLAWASRDVEIGVSIRDQDAVAAGAGAVVDDVRQDSPAARAGIKAGDVVVEFDGERVRSARHLSRLVEETASGHTVKLAVMREGKRVDLSVTPEEGRAAWFGADGPMTFEGSAGLKPGEPPFKMEGPHTFAFKGDGPFVYKRAPGDTFDLLVPPGRGRLGIGIQELTPQLAEYFGTKDGALVTSVAADSPAAKAGIRAGDVITAVNDVAVSSPSELIDAVRKAEDGASVKLAYTRDHKAGTAAATLEAKPKPKKPSRPA
jgi:serine protease Do